MEHNGLAMDDPMTSERFREVADLAGLSSGFEALFQAAPSPFLVITPPDYRIIAVNDEYLRATMTERPAIVGRTLFDVFPDNPDNPTAAGPPALRASLARVVAGRRTDDRPVVRYDIPRPGSVGGGFEERWWSPRNAPVLGPDGDVVCIIHRSGRRESRTPPDGGYARSRPTTRSRMIPFSRRRRRPRRRSDR